MTIDDTREQLAAYAHEAWAGWMRYLFSKSAENADGTVTIPAWAVERWQRQMNTPYIELPESEKTSDRAEAGKMLARMGFCLVCGQFPVGQSGEYPCPACGLPRLHDEQVTT